MSKRLLAIAILLSAVASGSYVAAEQTDFKLTIEPLECVVDITALGSIASSAIAPKECEKVIDTPPSFDTTTPTTDDGTRDTIIFTALEDPVTGDTLQIPSLPSVSQPIVNDSSILPSEDPDQASPKFAGVLIVSVAIITSIAFVNAAAAGTTISQVTADGFLRTLQHIRSWITKIR